MKIAIDGPSGVGKSTLAKEIAVKFNLLYLDTGAMYDCWNGHGHKNFFKR